MPTQDITILAYPGCMGMEVFGLSDSLLLANRVAQARMPGSAPLFAVRVVSLKGGDVAAAGGLSIGSRRAPRKPRGLLIVPGLDLGGPYASHPQLHLAAEVAYIARSFAQGVPVAALCVGAFLLGEAGLLDGRRATTAWLFAPDLARRFPAAKVEPAALLVHDGGVTTTGAFSATLDLAMSLVDQHAGQGVRRAVARIGLLDGARASQAPYVDARMLARPAGTFGAAVCAWFEQRLAEPYDLAALAAAFHVSTRTMLRRFRAEQGQSPLASLQLARIGKARLLLEGGQRSVAQVAESVGYGDVATFTQLFKRLAGHTPADYRRRFRAGQS